jgi:CRP-like cAMP-binding protein
MLDPQSASTAEQVLKDCTLFRDLDESGRRELAVRAHRLLAKTGETIFEVGSPGQSMMAVLKGAVRISLPSATGKEMILADLGPGDIFGEIALLDGRPRSATAIARKASVLLVLDRREVRAFLHKRPDFCLTLLELLCARLRRSDERMADIAFFDLPARLAKVLVSRASAASGGADELPFSQSDLAKTIGASREHVNRCLRDWQRRGIVDVSGGRVSIRAMAAIQTLAGHEV